MTEQQIQSKRIKELESEGYYVLKLVKTNKNGIPDLVAFKPNADVLFSEVKRPTGKVSKLPISIGFDGDVISNTVTPFS